MTVKISHLFRMTVKRKYSAMAVRFWEKVESIARKRREQRLASFLESDCEAGAEEKPTKTDHPEKHVTFKKTVLELIPSEIEEDHHEKSYFELKNSNGIQNSVHSNVMEESHFSKLNQQNRYHNDWLSTRPIDEDKNNFNSSKIPQQKVRTGVHIHPEDIKSIEALDSSQKTNVCRSREKDTFKDLDLKDLTDPQISSHSKDHSLLDVETFPVMFTWNKGGREVYLTGDFTRWKPVRMSGAEGAFVLTFHLPAGSYVYNFIVDDVMTHDDRVRTVYLVKMKRNKVSVSREANDRTRSVTEDWLRRRTYMGEAA